MPNDVNPLQSPAGEPTPPADITTHVQHDSTVGELVVLHLKFLALTLLTLGVYHFWARTKARRVLWQRTRLLGDPFSYLGRPLELLAGFVVAMVLVFVPITALNVMLATESGPEEAPVLASVLGAVQAVLLPYLIFVGGYAVRRYRLSRTAWRGIRGAQTGSAWGYGLRGYGYLLVTGITFGWYYPWQRAKLARYRLGHSYFGTQGFDCGVAGRHLAAPFAILWFGALAMIVTVPVVMFWTASMVVGPLNIGGGEPPTAAQQMILSFVPLAIYGVVMVIYMVYRAMELRTVARHTSFGDIRFELTLSVWQYVRYALGNMLIAVVTLGTGWIYLQRRQLKFWSRYLVISGAIDFAALQQTAETGPRTGEGLAELFDLGFEVGF